jgi:hypothetical protein
LQVGVGEGIAILQVWLYGCGIGLINWRGQFGCCALALIVCLVNGFLRWLLEETNWINGGTWKLIGIVDCWIIVDLILLLDWCFSLLVCWFLSLIVSSLVDFVFVVDSPLWLCFLSLDVISLWLLSLLLVAVLSRLVLLSKDFSLLNASLWLFSLFGCCFSIWWLLSSDALLFVDLLLLSWLVWLFSSLVNFFWFDFSSNWLLFLLMIPLFYCCFFLW